ncbi:DinB family protein [Pseudopedobacter beijingensis]|uniref:DinB family protein n=1 Tax=Pseudopedobacter beijingensis TaxID=1207056 RepID=A0ABW4I751_9SPHI
MTEQVFNFIIQTRQAFIQLVDSLSVAELNQIPEGFRNNIIWNFGHIVVSTQTLCYVRTGIKNDATEVKYNDDYKRDTKPSRYINAEEINELKSLAISTIESIREDYEQGVFKKVQSFATLTYKVEMTSFEEILTTTAGHDNIHLGYALAQKNLIKKQ